MSLELTGTVHSVGQQESGTSKGGKDWKKQSFVMVYKDGDYDKKVEMTVMGDKVDRVAKLGVGESVTVKFNLESREWNDKWYTNATAWHIEVQGGQSKSAPAAPTATGPDNDLPF